MREGYAMRKHSVQSRFSYKGNTRAVTEKRELHAFCQYLMVYWTKKSYFIQYNDL